MQNNAHSESREDRLRRFEESHPIEIIDTLVNSIDNHLNNEIRATLEKVPYQTSLLFLGTHAAILTISFALYDADDSAAYKSFLEKFVDGTEADKKFSTIADLLHRWRNVLAHQWLGSIGHSVGYDYDMTEGWKVVGDVTFINPKVYAEQYLAAFKAGSPLWRFEKLLSEAELEAAKARLLKKYVAR